MYVSVVVVVAVVLLLGFAFQPQLQLQFSVTVVFFFLVLRELQFDTSDTNFEFHGDRVCCPLRLETRRQLSTPSDNTHAHHTHRRLGDECV